MLVVVGVGAVGTGARARLDTPGDLCYLLVETATLKQTFQITAHIGGFFVNASNVNQFDPRPAARACAGRNLVAVLRQLDPAFHESLSALHKQPAELPSVLLLTPAFPVYPWTLPPQPHLPSPGRGATYLQPLLDLPELPGQVRPRCHGDSRAALLYAPFC